MEQSDLMIACKTGNVAAVREILEWRDDDDERLDISAKDENGQNALSFAKQSNREEIVAMIEQNLFLRAVENDDYDTVKTYLSSKTSNFEVLYRRAETDILTDNQEHNSEQREIHSREDDLIEEPPPYRSNAGFEAQFTSTDSITRSVWLKAVTMTQNKCHDEMLELLLTEDRFIHGINEDGQTFLYQVVAEYLPVEYNSNKLKTSEFLEESRKFSTNILSLQNETIFEIIGKIQPEYYSQIDNLLQVLQQHGIDLNGRSERNETFVMVACKIKHIDIVRSLIKLTSCLIKLRTYQINFLDIDAIKNFGKMPLKKAREKDFYEILVALLRSQLISALKDKNPDVVKSVLAEFRNTPDIFVKSWSSTQDRSKKQSQNEKTKSDIWLEIMHTAMKNYAPHSDEILKPLLDCDILLSQEIETGRLSFKQLMHRMQVDADKNLRLIELLLKTGKISVNDKYDYDEHGGTALHLAEEEKLISLLIDYGEDVNIKDRNGMTPLMHMRDKKVSVSLTILEKAGHLLDLNATDCDGRTALMIAAMEGRSDIVAWLLNKGASVNLSDHLGFTALHRALYGNTNRYFEFPRNSEELKKMKKEMVILFDAENHEQSVWRYEEWSEERKKIVEMLLQRPDIDVNLLSIELFSPLDIAEGTISLTPLSIKNALKEKGAMLNVFRQTESQSTSQFHLDVSCRWTLKHLCREIILRNDVSATKREDLDFFKERLRALIEACKEQIVSGKDQQGRTALHLTAISFNILPNYTCKSDLANTIVEQLISLGCNVNETDIFGRTPLHYADTEFWKLLKSKGADSSIKDKDGNIATDETSEHILNKTLPIARKVIYGRDETYLLRLMNNKQMEINVQCADDSHGDSVNLENALGLLWKEGEFAFRHPLFEQITNEVKDLMNAIAKEIERLDPRFEIKPILVGSSNEGTKLDAPDEFDFCFILTKISELCEVSESPEFPTGFVHIKRRPIKVGDTSDFDSFFGKDGIFNAENLNWQITAILRNALVNINSQLKFEWILKISSDYSLAFESVNKVLNIEMIKPLNFFTVNRISVDIVPCIHVDGWWPDDAISNVSDEIKKFGCNLVFGRPQKLYPWVPYSESCARISFSKAESDMIKQSCDNAREAYMIGKLMIMYSSSICQYNLKNCLLYCIEALNPSCEKASQLGLSLEELESRFHQMDRYLWLKCLMKCLFEFVAQDFCPCYFQQNFRGCSVMNKVKGHHKKISFDWIADRTSEFPLSCKDACAYYRCASNDISECSYQLPAPDPLWERFDRKQLIATLCEIAYK